MRSSSRRSEGQEIEVREIEERDTSKGATRVIFRTSNGRLDGIYHSAPDAHAAVIMVGGAGGGLNGPASVYEDLAHALAKHGIASLRLDYRFPNRLDDCVIDAFIGAQYLIESGIEDIGIIGWSFGGAVAITAAAIHDNIRAVATVATQSHGTEGASHLEDKPIFLLHGTADQTLSPACSEYVHEIASGPKEIKFYEGANHGLDQTREQMLRDLESFFAENLGQKSESEEERLAS